VVVMGILERLSYSRKFLVLTFLILYFDILYLTATFKLETIIICTAIAALTLLYHAYYAKEHRSEREGIALLTFVLLSMSLGAITGAIINPALGPAFYTVTMTVAAILILFSVTKLSRI